MTLRIICADGLDPELCRKWGLNMPFKCSIRIPDELFHSSLMHPFTPHVWGSIFSGKLVRHSYESGAKIHPIRSRIRKLLHDHGISWRRQGIKFHEHKIQPLEIKSGKLCLNLFLREIDDVIFDHYNSLTYHIPAIDNDFFMGIPEKAVIREWEINKELLNINSNHEIIAVYNRIPDFYGHRLIHEKDYDYLRAWYHKIFHTTKSLKSPTILLSDHGCNKEHTLFSYFGSTEPVYPKEIVDIRENIEKILLKNSIPSTKVKK